MKKILLASVMLAGALFTANAEETYAPESGDFSLEVQFNPFNGKDNKTFTMPALAGRYFVTDKDAITLDLGLNGVNNKSVADTENDDAFTKGYYGTFQLNLGYQRHFYQYKRVDLYAGAKVGYVHNFAGSTEQTSKDNKTWTNSYDGHNTGNGFSVYALTGIDFYVYKGLYVGCEIDLGFSDVLATNSKTKVTINGTESETKSKRGGHNFEGGFNVKPQIRLGWTF